MSEVVDTSAYLDSSSAFLIQPGIFHDMLSM